MGLENLRCGKFENIAQSTGHRYVIPIVELSDAPEGVDLVAVKSEATAIRTGSSVILSPEIMTEAGFEYPVINKKFLGRKNSFFYASGTYGESVFKNSITKFDSKRKETCVWKGTEDQYPGEPQIIPNPTGTAEDDAVLIAAVSDVSPGCNDFIVFIDAKNMAELGRCQFKGTIPQSFHGLFIS
jgi:carotenoid cleavage dioxygenase-like enzyme